MQNFFDRLKLLIERYAGGKHTVFAKTAGIPISTFQYYLDKRLPNAEHLVRISETYNTSLDWLLTGKGAQSRNGLAEGCVGEKEATYAGAKIDVELLKSIIKAIEEGLNTKKLALTPVKKAELIALVYDTFPVSAASFDPALIERYLRLIA